jgi:hypothetical protein
MKDDKDQQSKVSSCFEDSACAEMMMKILGEAGAGSRCEEIMRSLVKGCQKGRSEARKPGTERRKREPTAGDPKRSKARTNIHEREV